MMRSACSNRIIGSVLLASVLFLVAGALAPAPAHQPGESYLFLEAREDGLRGRAEFPAAMTRRLFGETPSGDALRGYTRKVLALFDVEGASLEYDLGEARTLVLENLEFSQVHFRLKQSSVPLELVARFEPFDDPEASRLALLVLSQNAFDPTTVARASADNVIVSFTPGSPEQRIQIPTKPSAGQLVAFAKRGLKQSWRSPAHGLFLFALLVPVVLVRGEAGDLQAVDSFGEAVRPALLLLLLLISSCVLGMVLCQVNALQLPPRVVGGGVGLSLAAAGVALLVRLPRGVLLAGVVLFGFFHGCSLGGTVEHLVSGARTAVIVLGGLGSGLWTVLAILGALVFLLLFRLRGHQLYTKLLVPGTGIALVAVGLWWAVDRAF